MLAKVLYSDPLSPTMRSSPALPISEEQRRLIDDVLDLACSDSKFKEKAVKAIGYILTAGNTPLPTVTSLVPNNVTLGSPSFTIHINGTGFDANTVIVFAGQEEPTTLVSPTEVTTGVNMDVWAGPDSVPVGVVGSNTMPFEFKAASTQATLAGEKILAKGVKGK